MIEEVPKHILKCSHPLANGCPAMTPDTMLTDCASLLEAIQLPDIQLPSARFVNADRDHVYFGVRYYAYTSIAHYRSILRGLVLLADGGNWSSANILTRHLLEWAAHATFTALKLKSLLRQENWDKGWKVLLKVNGGDLYFRRFGSKYLQENDKATDIPEPYALADFLGVYDSQCAAEDGRGTAKEDHALLSELSHASAACLRQHQTIYGNRIVLNSEEDSSPLSLASACTIDWLLCIVELLSSISDERVRPGMLAALRRLAQG